MQLGSRGLEFSPRPSGAKALAVAAPLQGAEGAGARCQGGPSSGLPAVVAQGAGGRPSC